MSKITFPSNFVWGAATSSYQIEGAWAADGKGESIWDRFTHREGNIADGSTGDIACDHYHRWQDDVELMRMLGMQAYRFSIAWPRVFPEGRGEANSAGIDFYDRLVDGLLDAGITPFVTLYHWDLPQALQDEGGWPARSTVDAFVAYADLVSRALGDRVRHWITHNEPWVITFLGHQTGEHAPGIQDWNAALRTAHHVLLSHGRAVPAIRANVPDAEVGITLNFTPAEPASRSAADLDATRHFDGYFHRWFLDPLYGRHYPADMVADYTNAGYLPDGMSFVHDGDLDTIAVPTDFLGVNYYTRAIIRNENVDDNLPQRRTPASDEEQWTAMDWEIYPDGLYTLLNRLHFEYNPPKLYITENGASFADEQDRDGHVRDYRRLRYLRDHVAAAHRAIQNGVPLAGYFVWSFVDNFEWSKGYTQRFGIVWVDYETQARIPKASAEWFRQVIAQNGFELDA